MKITKLILQNIAVVYLISIFVGIYYLVSVYLKNTDVFCVCPTRNSNLPKRPHPDVSNEKQIKAVIHVNVINETRAEKSNVMLSIFKHSIPLNFTAECRLSYSEGQKWLMCQFCAQ